MWQVDLGQDPYLVTFAGLTLHTSADRLGLRGHHLDESFGD